MTTHLQTLAEDGDSDEEDAGEGGSTDGEALSAGGVFIDAPMDSGSDGETAVSLRSWHPCRVQLLSLPAGCNGRYSAFFGQALSWT